MAKTPFGTDKQKHYGVSPYGYNIEYDENDGEIGDGFSKESVALNADGTATFTTPYVWNYDFHCTLSFTVNKDDPDDVKVHLRMRVDGEDPIDDTPCYEEFNLNVVKN